MNIINKLPEQSNVMQETLTQVVNKENIPNAVVNRLIEEVRNNGKNLIHAYDRTHSRHNRGR